MKLFCLGRPGPKTEVIKFWERSRADSGYKSHIFNNFRFVVEITLKTLDLSGIFYVCMDDLTKGRILNILGKIRMIFHIFSCLAIYWSAF